MSGASKDMIVDCHTHIHGEVDGERVLRAMDAAGVDRIVLFAMSPLELIAAGVDKGKAHQTSIDQVAGVAAADRDRIIPFAWIEPTLTDAVEAVDYGLGDRHVQGVKMIPQRWYPYDECAQACYMRINTWGAPMAFHSGSLGGTSDTSRFCRPVYWEVLLKYPRIRFSMAHLGWPWVDEGFAVMIEFRTTAERLRDREWQSYADTANEPPQAYRLQKLPSGIAIVGDTHFLYGSDSKSVEDPEALRSYIRWERRTLEELGLSQESIAGIMGKNALTWLGID
jgi:predicted TIM-barrel fold metal-dependent hydrolase